MDSTRQQTGVFWVNNLPLNAGTNVVTLWVTNAAGFGSVTNFSVSQNAMTLTLTNINGDLWFPTVNVSGIISDTSAPVWVNGVQGTNNGDGTWSATNVPVSAGGVASFDVTTVPTNADDPNMNTNSYKPDEVLTRTAHWGTKYAYAYLPSSLDGILVTLGEIGQAIVADDEVWAYKWMAAGSARLITLSAPTPLAQPMPDAAGNFTLIHLTECTAPGNTNNARTTIGIGEVVDLSFTNSSPGPTGWGVSGGETNGTISSIGGAGAVFTASMSPGAATVTVTNGTAIKSVTFDVIAPSSVTVLNFTDTPPSTIVTDGFYMGAVTIYTNAIGPTNVSFSNVYFRENPEPSSMTITWPNPTITTTNYFSRNTNGVNWFSCGGYTIGDIITSPGDPEPYYPINYLFNGTSLTNFSFGNSYYYQYKNESGTWTNFCTLNVTIEYSNTQCRVIFLGQPGGWQGPYY